MSTQAVELFGLSATGPLVGKLHGGALARAGAHAGATFRRGINLSAGFEIEAEVDASIRDGVAASLQAGVGARVGVALQAAMPLDLFTEAGLVVRLQAQAEAAAYVSASLGLEFDVFKGLVRDRLGPGPLADALDVFLEEAVIEAGFWARAAFAAEILGEATLTGSLLPEAKDGPGFSFVVQYGAGFGYGTGKEFQVNIGLEDPRRFVGRLADLFTGILLREAEKVIPSLPEAARGPAREAIPKLKVMLPLATRSAFEAGVALASGPADGSTATRSVAESFGREAQEVVLRAVLDFATEALLDAFQGNQLADAWVALPDQKREAVKEELRTLVTALEALDGVDPADVDRWLPASLAAVGPMGSLLDLGLLPRHAEGLFRDAMAYFLASATLVERLYRWLALPEASRGSVFGTAPVSVPNNSAVAAHIAARIQKPAGSALTHADLVRFLVGGDPIRWVRSISPVVSGAIDWLEDILQLESGEFLEYVMTELLPPDEAAVEGLLQRMGTGFGDALRDEVLPKLLKPIKDESDEAVGLFLDTVIVPTVAAFPAVILPRLTELDDEEGVLRFREALSAVLLQTVSKLMLAALEVLLDHALTQGHQAIRAASEEVEDLGEQFPAFGAVAAVASRAFLPISINPDDLAGLLRLAADATERWNDNHREPLFDLIEVLFALGMSDESTRAQTLTTLTTSDSPAVEADLDRTLALVRDSTLDMLGFLAPRLLELLVMHYVNEVKQVAMAIYEGAKAVVAAVEQAIAWLAEEIEKLRKKLEELAKEAARLGAQIAADIAALAEHLRTLTSQIVDSIRDAGWSLVDAVIPEWVPGWGVDIVKAIYNALFDAVKWMLTLPLAALNLVAGWARDLLTSLANGSALDAAGIKAAIRNKILALQSYTLTFTIKADLGVTTVELPTVSIPAGNILWAIVNAVLGDGTFDATVNGCATDATTMRQVEAQRMATEKVLNEELSEAEAQNIVGTLTTGQAVRATIHTPKDRTGHGEAAALKVEVAGANRSFVDPPLGVPRRIAVRLNGREFDYTPDRWTETATGLVLETSIPLPVAEAVVGIRPGTVTTTAVGPTATATATAVGPTGAPAEEPPPAFAMALSAGTPVMRTVTGGRRRYEVATSSGRLMTSEAQPFARARGAAEPDPEWASLPEPQQPMVARVVEAQVMVDALPPAARPATGVAANVIGPDAVLSLRSEPAILLEAAFDAVNVLPGTDPLPPVKTLVGQPGINALQVAVSDGKQETDSDSVVFFLGVRPAKPRGAAIVDVEANPPGRDVPEGERVLIRSRQDEPLDMSGWLLRDLARHAYRFPSFVLAPGEEVRVWTREGDDGSNDLYWGRRAAVWNNPGDSAVLQDATGREVSRFSYTAR